MKSKKACCEICKKEFPLEELFPISLIRPSLLKTINVENGSNGYICYPDMRELRSNLIEKVLEEHRGELSNLDQEVVESLEKHELVTQDINEIFEDEMTFGERASG